MKTFITTVLISLFISTQLMASICSYECALKTPEISSEHSNKKQNCHQQTADENEETSSSNNKNGCNNKLCQLNQIIKAENTSIDFTPIHLDNNLVFNFSNTNFHTINFNLKRLVFTESPPYYGQYSDVPLFIQKSSYII